MMRMFVLLCAVLAIGAVAAPAPAQPTKDELKVRFQSREPELRDLKRRGQLGETLDGYVETVERDAADDKVARLVSDENGDRRALYKMLADEINAEHPDAKVKATLETVARRNALRNIERAAPDEFLRVAKAHWIRVKDFPRFERLAKLKAQGRVGETGQGLLAIVRDSSDSAIARLVDAENTARAAEYKALAAQERVEVSVVATRMAKRNFDNAQIGEMLLDEPGSAWRKK